MIKRTPYDSGADHLGVLRSVRAALGMIGHHAEIAACQLVAEVDMGIAGTAVFAVLGTFLVGHPTHLLSSDRVWMVML